MFLCSKKGRIFDRKRNELLKATGYLLPDAVIDENKLKAIKIYYDETEPEPSLHTIRRTTTTTTT